MYFTDEERTLLDQDQQTLHQEVTKENLRNFVFLDGVHGDEGNQHKASAEEDKEVKRDFCIQGVPTRLEGNHTDNREDKSLPYLGGLLLSGQEQQTEKAHEKCPNGLLRISPEGETTQSSDFAKGNIPEKCSMLQALLSFLHEQPYKCLESKRRFSQNSMLHPCQQGLEKVLPAVNYNSHSKDHRNNPQLDSVNQVEGRLEEI